MASALVLGLSSQATARPGSTAGQLVVVLALMTGLGVRGVARAVRDAQPVATGSAGTGEPTPLWQLPLIVGGLTVAFGLLAGWDAALRIGGGCTIVGLVQAIVLERWVASAEARTGRRYFRTAGSRILRGSRLAYVA